MTYADAKAQFVQTWGTLGSEWGISRTMALIHALLMVSARPLSTEDVMDELQISRGNANQNLRELITWQLVEKVIVPGERREYFQAEKDLWEIARRVVRERKRREIAPVMQQLERLSAADVTHAPTQADRDALVGFVGDLNQFVRKLDSLSDLALKADESRIFGPILRMLV